MARGTAIGLVVGILMLGLGIAFWLRGDALLVGLFGPPEVELSETFTDIDGEGSFDHWSFDELLSTHVDGDGFVDYEGLAEEAEALDSYIATLASAPVEELGRDERLALLINAYNAFTLRLILDHYPLSSIKDIPSAERWDAERWQIAGQTYSLNQIEHELIRPNFREPRIHFALVCAAVGCPPLRAEAYTGEILEEQLDDQTRFTHANERWLRYQAGADVIELTALYQWYGGDFEQVAGTVLDYVAGYNDTLATDLAAGHTPTARYLEYDWALNTQ